MRNSRRTFVAFKKLPIPKRRSMLVIRIAEGRIVWEKLPKAKS
jgi:hypothetical protein